MPRRAQHRSLPLLAAPPQRQVSSKLITATSVSPGPNKRRARASSPLPILCGVKTHVIASLTRGLGPLACRGPHRPERHITVPGIFPRPSTSDGQGRASARPQLNYNHWSRRRHQPDHQPTVASARPPPCPRTSAQGNLLRSPLWCARWSIVTCPLAGQQRRLTPESGWTLSRPSLAGRSNWPSSTARSLAELPWRRFTGRLPAHLRVTTYLSACPTPGERPGRATK